MRSTGRGINPDVNIYDLSSDPVAYAPSVVNWSTTCLSIVENFAPAWTATKKWSVRTTP